MNFQTITIGGGNKNFFLWPVSLELVILEILKSKKITKHIHIGNIPILRLIFLYLLFLLNGIPIKKFIYKGQLSNLNSLSKSKNSIVISSVPLVGAITTLESWKYKLPVLIYDPGIFYINCLTFLKDDEIVWRDLNELKLKLKNVINNYEYYSISYYEHYKFLKKDSYKSNNFLIENSERIYKLNLKNKNCKNFILFRLIALCFKPIYIIGKISVIFFTVYILPIIKTIKYD